MAVASLPPVFIEFLGSSAGVKRAMADVRRESKVTAEESETSFGKAGRLGTAAIAGIGLAAAGAAAGAVKMAADFETQMTRVRTGAGETAGNMKMVSQGVLAMAGQVGQSTEQLTSGLYMVESAGYHGADALAVLKNSAMGAKVGAADLHTVTDAVTTAMNAYKMGADQSAQATNALIATEAAGKTNLEDLAGSMANILPTAAAAHVGLNEVLGAMATMTSQGTPAAVAATYLRQAVGNLSNPSGKAAQEMKSLGLNSVEVSQNLGKNGLASTLEMLTNAIQSKMGPAGTVLIEHLRKASKNTTDYQKVLAGLKPDQQTYIGALADMVGGTKSMQAALELTGPHMADFKANTASISEHVKAGGKNIEGWADVQKTLNQKLAQAKASLQAVAIQVGQYLMPAVKAVIGVISEAAAWMAKHTGAAKALAIAIGTILVVALAALTASLYEVAAAAVTNPVTWIILGVVALIAALVLLIMHWKEVWSFIKGAAKAVADAVVDAWHWVEKETSSVWHSITKWVTDTWNGIASWFSSAWHTVTDPIVAAWHWVENTTSAVWGAIVGFFRKWWPLLLLIFLPPIGILIAIWNHFHKQIMDTVHTVWNAITDFFKTVWGGLVSAAQFVWGLILTYISAPMLAVWHEIEHIWDMVMGVLKKAWNWILQIAQTDWALIKAYIIGPAMEIWHEIAGIFDRVKNAIGNALSDAWHAVENIGDKFLDIGKSIVMGIVHGVEHGAGALFDSLKGLADGALKSAKSFLGINSPSRLFADEVGQSIPKGVALGVANHAYLAARAVGAMSAGLGGMTVTPNLALPSGPGPYGGSYGAGGVQTAEVTTIVQIDGRELFRAMQPHSLINDRRNPKPGLVFARSH